MPGLLALGGDRWSLPCPHLASSQRACAAPALARCRRAHAPADSPATGGPHHGLLQKCAYSFVVFVAAPLIAVTGLAMSPAVTAIVPFLLTLFGGYQSARTIHFFTFVALLLFVGIHVVMIVKSGFRRQLRAMTVGE